jgi:hypothetical protein
MGAAVGIEDDRDLLAPVVRVAFRRSQAANESFSICHSSPLT